MCKLAIRCERFSSWLKRHSAEKEELYRLAPELKEIRDHNVCGIGGGIRHNFCVRGRIDLLYLAGAGMDHNGENLTALFSFGSWCISEMKGAEGAVWISHVWLNREFQGRGLGSLLHKLRLQYLKDMGYLVAHCSTYYPLPGVLQQWVGRTTELADKRRHILLKHGWIEDYTYESPQEGNAVTMWHKVL